MILGLTIAQFTTPHVAISLIGIGAGLIALPAFARGRLLRRATGFARFVERHVRRLAGRLELAVFRDPWGGAPLLRARPRCPALFEVNALPSWELHYSRPDLATNTALVAKLRDLERRCLREATLVQCVSSVTARALAAYEEGPA